MSIIKTYFCFKLLKIREHEDRDDDEFIKR